MNALDRELGKIFRESARGAFEEVGGFPVLEVNHCHGPGRGHPCTHSSLRVGDRFKLNPAGTEEYTKTGGSKYRNAKGDEGFVPPNALVYKSAGYSMDMDTSGTSRAAYLQRAKPASKRSPHKVERVSPGPGEHPDLVAKYRGMNINWQRPYQNSYYVDAPGFGSFMSKRSIGALRKEIDRFVDTGVTQHKAERARASARYQKRKARYGG